LDEAIETCCFVDSAYSCTDLLVDKAAEALYPTWHQSVEQWKLVGGDFGYH
jgi:hypothetical protein